MFICMILASALFVIFAILFLTAGDSLAKALIVCNVEIPVSYTHLTLPTT